LREFDREIADAQGRVVVVSFASPDHLKRFAERLGHPYLWLADPKRQTYHRLGLERKGLFAIAPPRAVWGYVRFALRGKIWHPEQLDMSQLGGDFVFDREGNLTLRHVSSSSDDRPSVSDVMSAFRRAANDPAGAVDCGKHRDDQSM
jgi:peroxiredoxin